MIDDLIITLFPMALAVQKIIKMKEMLVDTYKSLGGIAMNCPIHYAV